MSPCTAYPINQRCADGHRLGPGGIGRAISESELHHLALARLKLDRPELDVSEAEISEAIRHARTPRSAEARVPALDTVLLSSGQRGYRPFSYLVACDDGQLGPAWPIAAPFWLAAIDCCESWEASAVGTAADYRSNFRSPSSPSRRHPQRATSELYSTRV